MATRTRPTAEPVRTCIGCRCRAGQSDLIRLAAVDRRLVLGDGIEGRGAWLCRATITDCFDRAVSSRQWSRALRGEIAPDSVATIRAMLVPDSARDPESGSSPTR